MSDEQLNENLIKLELQGICQDCIYLDKIVPIIREMLSEEYKTGLEQSRFDKNMLEIENQKLKKQVEELKTTNNVLANELTKDTKIKQDYLTTCCGIPIGDIPKLKSQQKEFIKYLEDEIYTIEPKGTLINFNCDYDSEEDYIRSVETRVALGTLKNNLSKYKEIIGGKDE